jgi:hypothetical protein
MGCAVTVRGGRACQNRRLNFSIGPLALTLCNRHLSAYQEERAARLIQVEREHRDGLHGEGEDRKVFAQQYESDKFWLYCQKCIDELASEEIGVSPDQVAEGKQIKRAMEQAFDQETKVVAAFRSRLEKHALTALTSDLDSTVYSLLLAKHWRRVQMFTVDKSYIGGQYVVLNIVEAYNRVKEEVTKELITNRIDNANEREAGSAFVRLTRW